MNATEIFSKLDGNGRMLNTGIEPYAGPWTDKERLHLLRRTLFGITHENMEEYSELSMQESIDRLIQDAPIPMPPINDYNTTDLVDPHVPEGMTWIHDLSHNGDEITGRRVVSLKCWWIQQLIEQKASLHEKMVFFWHNHLATQAWEVYWPRLTYHHFDKLRYYAFGNFKTMVREITLDPHMLIYLNGAVNRQEAPDENYARELQELFCIGKGPNANFTEEDVQAAARVLTGHSIDWDDAGQYLYRPYWHDDGDKQFSAFYNNTLIKGRSGENGKEEVDDLIQMIFEQNEVAAYVVRKFYRLFVYSEIDQSTEDNVILPLAEIFRNNGYEIQPVLRTLLASAHFYDDANRGAMIKNPLDFILGFWRTGGVQMPPGASVRQQKLIRASLLWTMGNLGLEVMDPPNVAGYPAYYQFPQFDRDWITTNSITNRALVTDAFIYWGYWSEDLMTNIDLLKHVSNLPNPEDPVKLVDDLMERHLAHPASAQVRQRMVSTLLTGQQNNSYWTNAWFDYIDHPSDEMKRLTVELRLKVMFQFLMQLSEYHLV